jgi:integrase
MPFLKRGRNKWYAVTRTRVGDRWRESWVAIPIPGTASRRAAERAMHAMAVDAPVSSPTVTVADLVARYIASRASVVRAKTMSVYRSWLPRFAIEFGAMRLSQITSREIESWQSGLVSERYAPASIHQAMRTIRAMFRYAVDAGLIARSPTKAVAMVRIPRAAFPPFLTMDQFRYVLQFEKDPKMRAAYGLAAYAGLRLSEVAFLRWGHIDFEKSVIRIRNGDGFETKSGHERQVPLYPALRELLEAAGLGSKKALLFGVGASCVSHSWTHVYRAARKGWNSSGTGAPRHDLPEVVTFHGLRHSFATWAALHVPLPVLQTLLGHASITTTMIYATVRTDLAVEEAMKHSP